MPRDAFHGAGLLDERHEPQPAAAPWPLQHVDRKRPPHQLGPQIAVVTLLASRIMFLVSDRTRPGGRVGPLASPPRRRRPARHGARGAKTP